MNYTELFREKRLEYYQDTGISCNAVLMSDYFAKELMKEKGVKKVRFVVQHSTKKSKNRYIPINSKAKDLLLKHKKISE